MKLKQLTPKKNRAQAMVEFAIALPILLMLLYGLLETGRLLFLYSTIVTASRQAVRYGSATGVGTTAVPRYQDCAGIRAAAQRMDFLNAFDDEDIEIAYDSGPGPSPTPYCAYPLSSDPTFAPSNSSRILVTINGDFLPIIPRLVPFIERSVANGDPIKGISARTILVSITIAVTNTPDLSPSTPTSPPTDTPTSTEMPTDTPTPLPTDTPIFTDTPSQTPTVTLSPTATLSPTPSLTPTITNTPTITLTPTISPTAVPICNLTHGPISFSGSSMSMTITNPLGVPIQIQDITVWWNHDKGNQGGGNPPDRPLILVSVSWENPIWTGIDDGPSITFAPSPTTYIQPGTSTLTFTFNQSYDKEDKSEEILINLAANGCTGFPIHATNQ